MPLMRRGVSPDVVEPLPHRRHPALQIAGPLQVPRAGGIEEARRTDAGRRSPRRRRPRGRRRAPKDREAPPAPSAPTTRPAPGRGRTIRVKNTMSPELSLSPTMPCWSSAQRTVSSSKGTFVEGRRVEKSGRASSGRRCPRYSRSSGWPSACSRGGRSRRRRPRARRVAGEGDGLDERGVRDPDEDGHTAPHLGAGAGDQVAPQAVAQARAFPVVPRRKRPEAPPARTCSTSRSRPAASRVSRSRSGVSSGGTMPSRGRGSVKASAALSAGETR